MSYHSRMAERLRRERERAVRYNEYKQGVRNYEVDKEISYYEQVTQRTDAYYSGGYVRIGLRRWRLAEFRQYVRQLEAEQHEKSLAQGIDN